MKPAPLLPLEDALAHLLASAPPPPAATAQPLHALPGRILAEPVAARLDVPPQDNSAMDGYAVRAGDAGATLPLAQQIAAGDWPQPLPTGAVARIFTGAVVPAGADAVVMQEDCERVAAGIRLPDRIDPGQHIRRRGQDTRTGERLLARGRRLRPQDIGLLASQGLAEAPVFERLRVALLSTGNELVEPGVGEPGPGQIYNSNRPMLLALLSGLGCEAVDMGIVADTPEATREALGRAAAAADVVISTGGVSVGDADHVRDQVAALGELGLWRIAIKPGKPFAFGQVRDTPFLGLPGNPSSAFVTFVLLARPFLCACQGRVATTPRYFPGVADFTVARPGKRTEFLRVSVTGEGAEGAEGADGAEGRLRATPFHNQSSGVLSSLSSSDALAVVPRGSTVAPGDRVDLMLLDELLS